MIKLLITTLLISLLSLSCKDNSVNSQTQPAPESMNEATKYTEPYKLSLAQWSLHKALQSGDMDNLEFADKAKILGFSGVEYVNQFFKDKAEDTKYLDRMIAAANTAGVKSLLIMIDGEGYIGDLDKVKRDEAINNHKKWIDAAKYLGCHSIRVNAHGEGTEEEVSTAAIDGLRRLSQYAATKGINVLVENHGGYSSNGMWLANVMESVALDNCGTLPDFGNFCIQRENGEMWGAPCIKEYDKYKGVSELMPYAKALSAKSLEFDENGNETTINYSKMISIAREAGYNGYIGVEYEGETLSEEKGIIATRDLIKRY